MTKEEILEKHYTNYEKRIGYPDNVFAAMEEYAQLIAKNISLNPVVSGQLPLSADDHMRENTANRKDLDRMRERNRR